MLFLSRASLIEKLLLQIELQDRPKLIRYEGSDDTVMLFKHSVSRPKAEADPLKEKTNVLLGPLSAGQQPGQVAFF